MKILYHHRTQCKLAEGVHIREIINALRARNHEVYIVAPPGVNPDNNVDLIEDFNKNTVKKSNKIIPEIWKLTSNYLPEIFFELLEIAYNLFAYSKIKIIIKKDIDFIYERYAFFGGMCTYLAKKNKIPIILEVNEICGIKRTRGQCLTIISKYIEKKVFEKVDAIVVVSRFLKEQIELKGIDSSKIYVIPNAVDITKFDINISNNDILKKFNLKNKIVLGFVGSFVKWHNFEFLLKTFNNILKEKKTGLILILVGDGPMKFEIEKIIEQMKLNQNIIFTGAVEHNQIPKYIKTMDICIIPQSNEFRSPIKMFEYMAISKPVVAPDIGPIKEVIKNNINGVLFEQENEDSLKKAIITLIEDSNKRKEIGIEARKTILSGYLWIHNADKVINIYNRIKKQIIN